MEFDNLSRQVIGCAIEVHKVLGAGLLESTYEKCLEHELYLAGLSYTAQELLPVSYKGVELDCGYRLDRKYSPPPLKKGDRGGFI